MIEPAGDEDADEEALRKRRSSTEAAVAGGSGDVDDFLDQVQQQKGARGVGYPAPAAKSSLTKA
jgi:hypothetical protein